MDNSNENVEITVTEQEKKLKERIPYNEAKHISKENYDSIIKTLLEDSKNIGLSLKFPYDDYSNIELPAKYNNWQIRCCLELYNLAGKENVQSYAENGLSWTMFKSGLSQDLISEIIPNVAAPRSESDDTNV